MEIELKLAVSPTALNRLIRHPIWSSWRCSDSRQTLRSIYFDTANADLTAAGYALRLRRAGRRWVQTVKGGGGAAAGLHRRDEFESEVRGPQPDFTKMPDRLLDGVLADATVRGQLLPAFETRFTRLARTVHLDDGSVVEVAFDRGNVIAGDRTAPLCEVELELKHGQLGALLGLARAVLRQGGGWLDDTTKAARGYRLAMPDRSPVASPVSAGSASSRVFRDWHALMAEAVQRGLNHLHGNAAGVRDQLDDPEYVHQMRVAARRIKTLLGIAQRESEHPLTSHLLVEVSWLANSLGAARDWDVLLGETLPSYLQRFPAPPGLARLQADGEALRRQGHELAAAAVGSTRYGELLIDLMAWLHRQESLDKRRALGPAREQLGRRHKQVLKLGEPARLVDDEARHRLRLACKKLRYAAESLAPAFPSGAASGYISAVARLQNVLGGLNDAAVAAQRLDTLPAGRAERARQVLKRALHNSAQMQLTTLPDQWDAFVRQTPFWKA